MLVFIANSLSERGFDCAIVNLNTVPEYVNAHRQVINAKISVVEIPNAPSGKNKNVFRIKKIKEFAEKFRADVLVGFTEFPNFYATVVGKILHVPSIISERGDPLRVGLGIGFKNKIVFEIINRASGGVFQTGGAQAYYGKGLQKRGMVIPNPIFIKEKIPQIDYAEREKTVVSVGRLDNEQKRYDIMLQAFQLFHKKHPEYVLKLYGKGSDEERIRAWANELGIHEKVQFMGLTTQPMTDIAKDGMFLITSDYEGISNSLLEAMAVGLPCVSTDHTPGGARLLIQDRENGLLAPIGDAKGLAEAMCSFAESPELAKKCGNNAKDVIHRFAPEKIIDMWEAYITAL